MGDLNNHMQAKVMKVFFISIFLISFLQSSEEKSNGAWSDIKKGTRGIIRGVSKGVKKAAEKVEKKMDENESEDAKEKSAEDSKELEKK